MRFVVIEGNRKDALCGLLDIEKSFGGREQRVQVGITMTLRITDGLCEGATGADEDAHLFPAYQCRVQQLAREHCALAFVYRNDRERIL